MEPQITSLVARVIRENTGLDVVPAVEDPLINSGYLDSMTLVSLVIALQTEFAIEFDIADMSVENFQCVRSITELVQARR